MDEQPIANTLDLTALRLRPAPESEHVAGLLEVETDQAAPRVPPPGPPDLLRGAVFALVAVLAPFAVLLVVLALPVGDVVRGALLVAGWVALGAGARLLDRQRERR